MEEKIDMTVEEVKDFTEEELADETVDWKAKAQESLGIAKRRTTQLEKAKTHISELETKIPKEPEPQNKKESQSENLDYGQLAFYNSKSDSEKLELDEDIEYLKDQVKETGKSQTYILGSKWFQSELKARKETRVSKNAVPSGSSRSTTTAKDSADYWLDKPFSDVPAEMKAKVVARRMEKEKSGSDFIA